MTLLNPGSSVGATGWGAVGAGGQATARCRNARTAGRRIILAARLAGGRRAGLWPGREARTCDGTRGHLGDGLVAHVGLQGQELDGMGPSDLGRRK